MNTPTDHRKATSLDAKARRARSARGACLLPQLVLGFTALCVLASPAHSENLMDVYTLAIESDPTYRAAVSGNRASQELRPQARAAMLPTVGLSASLNSGSEDQRRSTATRLGGRRGFDERRLGLNLRQPLYRQDLWVALDQADLDVKRSNVDLAVARQDLIVRVADAYFGVLEAEDTLAFAMATQDAFGQQLEQSQQRFEVGLIAITDVEEAKAGSDRARADVIVAKNALDTARENLREVTGRYLNIIAGLVAELPLETPEPDDIDAWTETALRTNLSLGAALLSADTAREEIRRQESGHLPTVDLVASHARVYDRGGISGDSDVWSSSVGLELNVPIYEGGIVLSRTRQSQHLHAQALDVVAQARRSAQRETRTSFLGVESAISTVQALEQAVVSADAAREAIQAGFEVGTRTSVDVLDADRDVFQARRDLAVARYDYVLNVLRLKQAAGTLSEQDLAAVNSYLR